jgi:hypothetical protein
VGAVLEAAGVAEAPEGVRRRWAEPVSNRRRPHHRKR